MRIDDEDILDAIKEHYVNELRATCVGFIEHQMKGVVAAKLAEISLESGTTFDDFVRAELASHVDDIVLRTSSETVVSIINSRFEALFKEFIEEKFKEGFQEYVRKATLSCLVQAAPKGK